MTIIATPSLPIVIGLIGCVLIAGCSDRPVPPTAEVRPVRTMEARSVTWNEFPSQVGEVRPHVESDLGFKIAGKVLERGVKLGTVVRKGDVLARLDEGDQRNRLNVVQAEKAAAQASLVQAEAEERRQAELLAGGWTTRSRYDAALRARDAARAGLRAAEANRRLAEDHLGYTVLRASEDGVVSAIGAEPGQVVGAGQMVVRLAGLERKDAVFTLAESTVLRLPSDAEVEVRLLDAPEVMAVGRIEQLAPNSDPLTRTYTVKVALDTPPEALRLGMTVVGRVRMPGRKVIPLPASALFEKDGAPAVWVVDPERETVKLAKVDLLRNDPAQVLVTDGLSDGDLIVTAGVQRIWEGLKVRLIEDQIVAGGQG